jgi:hypothetical protein
MYEDKQFPGFQWLLGLGFGEPGNLGNLFPIYCTDSAGPKLVLVSFRRFPYSIACTLVIQKKSFEVS